MSRFFFVAYNDSRTCDGEVVFAVDCCDLITKSNKVMFFSCRLDMESPSRALVENRNIHNSPSSTLVTPSKRSARRPRNAFHAKSVLVLLFVCFSESRVKLCLSLLVYSLLRLFRIMSSCCDVQYTLSSGPLIPWYLIHNHNTELRWTLFISFHLSGIRRRTFQTFATIATFGDCDRRNSANLNSRIHRVLL